MIQIRNVPDDLHSKLKARAAKLGLSLSDYLLSEIEEAADKPTLQEWLELAKKLPPRTFEEDTATIIRRHRDGA